MSEGRLWLTWIIQKLYSEKNLLCLHQFILKVLQVVWKAHLHVSTDLTYIHVSADWLEMSQPSLHPALVESGFWKVVGLYFYIGVSPNVINCIFCNSLCKYVKGRGGTNSEYESWLNFVVFQFTFTFCIFSCCRDERCKVQIKIAQFYPSAAVNG